MARKRIPHRKGKMLELSVVGINHRVSASNMERMEKALPIPVELEREPGNTADANAIKVVVGTNEKWDRGDWHIGYVRRSMAEILAPLMDAEDVQILSAELTELDVEEGREGTMEVVVESNKPLEL